MRDFEPADNAALLSLLPEALLRALRQPEPPPAAIADGCALLTDALAAITPFVPSVVLNRRLAQLARLTGMPLVGTVLYIDISDYTDLAFRLPTRGRAGNEARSALLRQLLGIVLDSIACQGGGLVKFGGNSLTAFFDASELGLRHASYACSAALDLQQRMVGFDPQTTSHDQPQLQLRMTIHSGTMFAAEVGNASHNELLLTGRAINRVVTAMDSAAAGEVLLSDETLQSLDEVQVEQKLTGLYRLCGIHSRPSPPAHAPAWQPSPPSIATLRALLQRINILQPYLPFRLPRRFMGAQSRGEFRPVTILFAQFEAFSKLVSMLELPAAIERDPAIVGQVLDLYYVRTQAIVHQYGGTINKIDMATAGDRLLAVFGAPTAHEDDPARAVEAALAMRAALEAINAEAARLVRAWIDGHPKQRPLLRAMSSGLRQRIAIASGHVFAGILGTPQRHDYMMIGETVDIAAQLLATAGPEMILLTGSTYQAVQHLLDVEPMPPLILEGKSTRVPIYQAVQHQPATRQSFDARRHSVPLAGRKAELAQLLELAQQAFQSAPQGGRIAILTGEPGIGKSRLANEALARIGVASPTALIIRHTCQSYDQMIPYVPITRLLHQLLSLTPGADSHSQARMLREQLDSYVPAWSRFAPLIGSLLDLPLPETDLTQTLSPEQRRDRLHDLIVALFLAIPPLQSRIVVVDDLQWADASTRMILERLATDLTGRPFLLLLLYRPGADLAEPWRELDGSSTIVLGELTRPESEALVRALLDDAPPPELWPLIDRTQNTPFFLEETVHYLLESGMLRRDSQQKWVYTRPIIDLAIPTQVEQLIVGRLDRLSETTRTLIESAAVIGPQFSEQLLAAVAPEPAMIEQSLSELLNAAMILHDQHAILPTYQFKHALFHDVVYANMLFAQRREAHMRVATAIELVYAEELDRWRERLAQHYLQAEQPDLAFPHFVAAAEQAQARYANSEALAYYSQALSTAPWRDQSDQPNDFLAAARLYESIGDVLALIGNYIDARWNFEWTLRLLDRPDAAGCAVRSASLRRKVGRTYESQGNFAAALHWLTQAQETLARSGAAGAARLEEALILSDTGWIHFRQGDLDHAQQMLEHALGQLRSHAIHDEQASILNRLGGISWTRGDLVAAQQFVEQSLAASQQVGDLIGQAQALNNLGILSESQGWSADSIRYSLQAMEINEQIGSQRDLAINANNVGWAFYNLEEYLQARQYFTQALEYASAVRDSYQQMRALLNLGRTLTALEQWDGADRALQQSQFIAAQLHLPAEQLDGYVALATLALYQADIAAADQTYSQALPFVADHESEEYGRLQRLEAQLAYAHGQLEQATELLIANEALFTRLQNMPEAERTKKLLTAMRAP
jgi:predicted ATPase/class 3 adenylate cyclase